MLNAIFTIHLWSAGAVYNLITNSSLRIFILNILIRLSVLRFNTKPNDGQADTHLSLPTKVGSIPGIPPPGIEDLRPKAPLIIYVTRRERRKIGRIARRLMRRYPNYDNPVFLAMLHIHAYRMMPSRIAKLLSDFAIDHGAGQFGAIVFRGLVDVDQEALGSTPETWREVDNDKIQIYGFVSALMHACARGVLIQQYYQRKGGGFMHAVIPNRSMMSSQTGEGYATPLFVHTEDPCLNGAADFISFLFLRNEECAPSMLHSIRSHDLSKAYIETLRKPIFKFPMDGNYAGEEKIGGQRTASILSSHPTLPFMRFDAAEQLTVEADQIPEAQEALEQFWSDAQGLIHKDYIPQNGDMVFLNNGMVTHGRSAFLAGFKRVQDELIPCEKRWMLRMMSTGSYKTVHEYTLPDRPFLSLEKHFGELFENPQKSEQNG